MSERISPQQIVDDFFHEYCEGRLDREEMTNAILTYARQYADERDEYNMGNGGIDGEFGCYNCTHVAFLTAEVAECGITHEEHKWEYSCNKHKLMY